MHCCLMILTSMPFSAVFRNFFKGGGGKINVSRNKGGQA